MFNAFSLFVAAVAAASAFATPTGGKVHRQAIGQTIYGGLATYYFQGGVAGACGQVNPDSALIVAEQSQRYQFGSDCGRLVQVTNTQNGRSVVATVADECPGCQGNANSLDLSQGAFDRIADESEGIVPITWEFLN